MTTAANIPSEMILNGTDKSTTLAKNIIAIASMIFDKTAYLLISAIFFLLAYLIGRYTDNLLSIDTPSFIRIGAMISPFIMGLYGVKALYSFFVYLFTSKEEV